MSDQDWRELTSETQEIWDQNAGFWDDYMGEEGNHFYKFLVAPTAEALLNVKPGESVLEIACGNGNFSRHLARLGAQVAATDFSPTFIARAQARTTEHTGRITYQVVDATSKAQLLALGKERFDAVVSNMALMDMPTIEPLFESLAELLKPGGRFVFSIMHPCFQPIGVTKVVEQEDQGGEMITRHSVKISSYIKPAVSKGLGIIGQPTPQYYFHRPLSLLFKPCFEAGFVLDGLEEPVFDPELERPRAFSWANYKEIPPVLMVRMRLQK